MNKQSSDALLQNAGIETSVIAGIIQHGPDCLLDIEEIVSINDFYWHHIQAIFNLLQYLTKEKDVKNFDIPSILSASKEKSCEIIKDGDPSELLESIFHHNVVSQENVQKLAVIIYKLSLARQSVECLIGAKNELLKITGQEDISSIIEKLENPVFDLTGKLTLKNNETRLLCDDFIKHMKNLTSNPQDVVGLPTGYPKWDIAIGGGLRRGTVNVVGARAKVGKSYFALNVARNMAENKIPVLYLDTELTREEQMNRFTSLMTGIEVRRIETGKFGGEDEERKIVWDMTKEIIELPISHCSIAGQDLQNAISFCRRWLTKYVGFNNNGQANPCLIIYDYLKLTNSKDMKNNMQEHQLLGFLISSLHDFAVRYSIPVLATVQLNRDGVKSEGGEFIAASDRILWLCSNFSILKNKSRKELAEDPPSNGTKKLVVTDTRYGPGMEEEKYINIINELNVGKLREGKTYNEAINDNFINN